MITIEEARDRAIELGRTRAGHGAGLIAGSHEHLAWHDLGPLARDVYRQHGPEALKSNIAEYLAAYNIEAKRLRIDPIDLPSIKNGLRRVLTGVTAEEESAISAALD